MFDFLDEIERKATGIETFLENQKIDHQGKNSNIRLDYSNSLINNSYFTQTLSLILEKDYSEETQWLLFNTATEANLINVLHQ